MFLNLQVFAFEGQDMTFAVNVLLCKVQILPSPSTESLFTTNVGLEIISSEYFIAGGYIITIKACFIVVSFCEGPTLGPVVFQKALLIEEITVVEKPTSR